jgi:hypothetical protein
MKNIKSSLDDNFYFGIYCHVHECGDNAIGWKLKQRIWYRNQDYNMMDPYLYATRTAVKDNFKPKDKL